tara:strand:- start:25686 stop:26678 length:993 start_codon:yes stop_codon:yes gene_type:complete
MKRILITGASGFIGGFLVEKAISLNFEVYAGVRKNSDIEYLKNTPSVLFEADLSDKRAIISKLEQFEKFDFIIHNAGITKTCNNKLFYEVNVKNTKNLIEALYETNRVPEKFIYISSLAACGPGLNGNTPVQLSDEPKPVSFYGASKLDAERYIKSLPHFPYLIFRPTGVYGPREKDFLVMFKSLNHGLETYIGSSVQYLSFVYVKDLTHLLLIALTSNKVQRTYFVSDLNNYTAKAFNLIAKKELNTKTIRIILPKFLVKSIAVIFDRISCAFNFPPPTLNIDKFKEISQQNWLCDSSQLVSDFGFVPEYNLKKGIKETIKWYKNKQIL